MVKGTMVTFSLDLTNQRLSAGDIRWQLFLFFFWKIFVHQWPYPEWPSTSDNCWKELRKRSNLVWNFKLLRYSILKQI